LLDDDQTHPLGRSPQPTQHRVECIRLSSELGTDDDPQIFRFLLESLKPFPSLIQERDELEPLSIEHLECKGDLVDTIRHLSEPVHDVKQDLVGRPEPAARILELHAQRLERIRRSLSSLSRLARKPCGPAEGRY